MWPIKKFKITRCIARILTCSGSHEKHSLNRVLATVECVKMCFVLLFSYFLFVERIGELNGVCTDWIV